MHICKAAQANPQFKALQMSIPSDTRKNHDLLTCAKLHGATIISEKMPHERLAQSR